MHRVYFDGNDRTERNCYGLWLAKSKEDLAKIPSGPQEGMKVTIYSIGEIEMEAILGWSTQWNSWTARGIEETIRPNHEVWN
jgi:hypothetical protein